MNNISGVTILSETSTIINHPVGDYHANFLSILCFVSMVVLIIMASIIFSKENIPPIMCGLGSFFVAGIAAALLLIGWISGYEQREDEIIRYEITIDETTPYLALQKYHLIKEENGIYTFETPLTD